MDERLHSDEAYNLVILSHLTVVAVAAHGWIEAPLLLAEPATQEQLDMFIADRRAKDAIDATDQGRPMRGRG